MIEGNEHMASKKKGDKTMTHDVSKNNKASFPLWLIVSTLVLWLAFFTLREEISSVFGPFLLVYLFRFCVVLVGIVSIACLVRTIYCWKVNGFSRAISARLLILLLLAVPFYVPIGSYYEGARFSVLASSFDRAAEDM